MYKTPQDPNSFIDDLNSIKGNPKSIRISSRSKNLQRLKEFDIENLWLSGANEKDLFKIVRPLRLKYLNLYCVSATDLTELEKQETIEGISIEWNSKSTTLWNLAANPNLKHFEIKDFSKINDISEISKAVNLESLTIEGGMNKAMKIESLSPLENLQKLEHLTLNNIKIVDDSLLPISKLTNLKELGISNQFETRELAFLSVKMPNTKCKLFRPYTQCNITNAEGILIWDIMITGKRKPFLLTSKDELRIKKYVENFKKLQDSFT